MKQSNSWQATQKLGERLIKENLKELEKRCLFLALEGNLGSGKTQFVKGLGKGLKIKQTIKSPTFTLIHEHPYKLGKQKGILFHVDAWRLDDPSELADLQLEKMIESGNIVALEWAQKGKNVFKKIARGKKVKIINLKFSHLGNRSRKIEIT